MIRAQVTVTLSDWYAPDAWGVRSCAWLLGGLEVAPAAIVMIDGTWYAEGPDRRTIAEGRGLYPDGLPDVGAAQTAATDALRTWAEQNGCGYVKDPPSAAPVDESEDA